MTHEEFLIDLEKIMSGEKHLSFSALKSFLKSPRHYYMYKTKKKSTQAMEQGKQFHMACLEPDKFKKTYWVLDDEKKCEELIKAGAKSPRSTSDYKQWVSDQKEENSGKEMLSIDDFQTYLAMSHYLQECPSTKDLMKGLIEKESEFNFWNEFNIVGKIDGKGSDYIIDLKKCADARLKKIRWVIQDEDYDLQGAIYCSATGIFNYFLIFIDADCNVTVVKLSEESIQRGLNKLHVATREFQRCAEENLWLSSYEFFNGNYVEI